MDNYGQPLVVHNCENIDQAVSRDLLCDAMIRLDACGVDLCMHCHDETVSLCGVDDAATPKLVHALMKQVEPWAEGVPVDAETKTGVRYCK